MFITNLLLSHHKYLFPSKIDHTSFYSCLDEQLEIIVGIPTDSRKVLTDYCEVHQNDPQFLSELYSTEASPDCWNDLFHAELKQLRNLNWSHQ